MNSLIRSAVFSVLGFSLAYTIVRMGREIGDWWPLICAAALASCGVSFVLWRLLRVAGPPTSATRGTIAGALTGLLAHPVSWYLAIVWRYLTYGGSSLAGKPIDPLAGIAGCLVYSFWSLLLTGWLTVPAGAIAGRFLARFDVDSWNPF